MRRQRLPSRRKTGAAPGARRNWMGAPAAARERRSTWAPRTGSEIASDRNFSHGDGRSVRMRETFHCRLSCGRLFRTGDAGEQPTATRTGVQLDPPWGVCHSSIQATSFFQSRIRVYGMTSPVLRKGDGHQDMPFARRRVARHSDDRVRDAVKRERTRSEACEQFTHPWRSCFSLDAVRRRVPC